MNKFTAGEDSKLPYRWISGRARNWARGPAKRNKERMRRKRERETMYLVSLTTFNRKSNFATVVKFFGTIGLAPSSSLDSSI